MIQFFPLIQQEVIQEEVPVQMFFYHFQKNLLVVLMMLNLELFQPNYIPSLLVFEDDYHQIRLTF